MLSTCGQAMAPSVYLGVSLTATNLVQLRQQVQKIQQLHLQHPLCVEWRLDYWLSPTKLQLIAANRFIQESLPHCPLILTLRTQAEGGQAALTPIQYLRQVYTWRSFLHGSFWDLQWQDFAALSAWQRRDLFIGKVIWSHHFAQAVSQAQLQAQALAMQTRARLTDGLKLAMPSTQPADNLALLQATWQLSQTIAQPLVTMAMGPVGQVTRLLAPLFGSCLSFGALSDQGSAPGQLPIRMLDKLMVTPKITPMR